MIPRELAKKIRYLQITTSRAVNDVLAGEYESVFKGRGMEFDEVREYTPGDEVRSIDWNVTARMGHPYVKRFREERELTVVLLVDVSASGVFGSTPRSKNEMAAELCALLAFAAVKNNDKVGLILFTESVERFIPPGKGLSHVLLIIREILGFSPAGRGTDIAGALGFLGRTVRRKSVVFLVSDFLARGYEKPMRVVARRHDLIAVSVTDPREETLQPAGLITVEDAETGAVRVLDSGSRRVRERYARAAETRRLELRDRCRAMGVDRIELVTDRDYVRDLVGFFRTRERRRRTG